MLLCVTLTLTLTPNPDQVLDKLLKEGGWLARASFGWLRYHPNPNPNSNPNPNPNAYS